MCYSTFFWHKCSFSEVWWQSNFLSLWVMCCFLLDAKIFLLPFLSVYLILSFLPSSNFARWSLGCSAWYSQVRNVLFQYVVSTLLFYFRKVFPTHSFSIHSILLLWFFFFRDSCYVHFQCLVFVTFSQIHLFLSLHFLFVWFNFSLLFVSLKAIFLMFIHSRVFSSLV